ncbi:uncharacterized protein DEA37_0002886 [Paragonimus westermani]|uniref:Uncharacterized protein n=1 Tax=Paragonimus westermani TaxID=34504 RepID=A0A5J4NSA8_9TREM|nr:uncharacterized protein DEA37_0002886 [Paragonimus westermani]
MQLRSRIRLLRDTAQWFLRGGQGENRPRRRHLWTDCICLFIMLPLMTLCAWLTALSGRTDEGVRFSWQGLSLGSLFGILFCVFFVWLVFSVRYHRQSWQLWRKNNQHISLREYRTLNEGTLEQPHPSIHTICSQIALNSHSTPVENAVGRRASLPLLLEKQTSSAVHSPSEHNVRSLTLQLLSGCQNERRRGGTFERPMTIHLNRLDSEQLSLTTSLSAPSVITEKTYLVDMNMVRVVDKTSRPSGVPIAMQSIIPLKATITKTATPQPSVSSQLDPVLSETC